MNAENVTVRAARSNDATAICALVRDAFAPDIRSALVYGAAGAAAWVRAEIKAAPFGERAYTVALSGRTVVGVVDLRRIRETVFLSYIAVDPTASGQGVAARLLAAAVNDVVLDYSTFALDVFTDNHVAKSWYARLGLAETSVSAWWAFDLASYTPTPDANRHVVLSGYAAADAVQRAYGFSQFSVVTSRSEYTVGRIGRMWFRVTDPAATDDASLLAALHALDSHRRLLVITPNTRAPSEIDAVPITIAQRMEAPLAEVRARLVARAPAGQGQGTPTRRCS